MRSRSPPGAGRTKRPSSACRMPAISWSCASRRSMRGELARAASRGSSSPREARFGRRAATSASTASRVGTRAVRRLGHRQQHLDALLGRRAARRRRAGRAGSACIRVPAPRRRACRSPLGRRRPRPARPAPDRAPRLRLDQRREFARARDSASGAGCASGRATPSGRPARDRARHGRPAASDS